MIRQPRLTAALLAGALLAQLPAGGDERAPADPEKLLREKALLVRNSPKRFATFHRADASRREVELLMEGEDDVRVWTLDREAEIKVHGFWGRLDDLKRRDRVWVWLRLDRQKRPVRVFMLADELSEQEIHGIPWTLDSIDVEKRAVVLRRAKDGTRRLELPESLEVRGEDGAFTISPLRADATQPRVRLVRGDDVHVQTAGKTARLLLRSADVATLRDLQRERMRARWRAGGLPGTVGVLHAQAGECELILDHEAMRWARHLKAGKLVDVLPSTVLPSTSIAGTSIAGTPAEPIRSVLLEVRPWRERTRLRLAVKGSDQSDLTPGGRVAVGVPEPPATVLGSPFPPDVDRERSRAERIEWFLASTYCACSIAGDSCTGMFYTLSGCNPRTCGMPGKVTGRLGELIDRGLDDRAILVELQKELGELILKQHLLR